MAKILVISNYQDTLNSVRPEGEIFIRLQEMGHRITLMTKASGVYLDYFRTAGINLIDFHPTKKISWSAIKTIRQELVKGAYDVLHCFNSKAISNANFAALGLPVKVLAYRGVIGGSSWWNPNAYLKHLHPRVDGITAVSKAVQKYMQRQLWWDPKKVKQFYKGQSLAWYQSVQPIPLRDLSLPDNAYPIACVANNRRWKGIKYLIEAANYLPPNLPLHFLLIGRSMDTAKNLTLINRSPYANNFHLLGHRKDVLAILAASKIYVQPSLKNKEGLGKAILEAQSLGIPPIVTDTGGPPEFVIDGASGLTVPPKNSQAIAKNIVQLYNNEPLRIQLGQGAQSIIRGPMNITQSAKQLHQIYQVFINGKS